MVKPIAPALKALLNKSIDYAGMFPPAALSMDIATANYQRYRDGDTVWMLRWLVIAESELQNAPRTLDGSLALLSNVDEARAAILETKQVVAATRPAYCEVSIDHLPEISKSGCFAKIRTGGLKPEAIPPVEDVAAFILACADLRLPFKATAGLHHAIRAEHALTYEVDSPRAVMHGFVNVFMASAFAWHGDRDIVPILSETESAAFRFDERAHWRHRSLDVAQISDARENFVHSVGSCSFDEPVSDLQGLGLL